MDLTYCKVKFEYYFLFLLALLAFGFWAVGLLPLIISSARNPDNRNLRFAAYLFSFVFIGYGIGRHVALYENANLANCSSTIEYLKFRFTGGN